MIKSIYECRSMKALNKRNELLTFQFIVFFYLILFITYTVVNDKVLVYYAKQHENKTIYI